MPWHEIWRAMGLALAVVCAVPIGLMMGRSHLVAAFFNPLMMVIYPVPKAALMPIIMLWLGVGEPVKILAIFLGVSLLSTQALKRWIF